MLHEDETFYVNELARKLGLDPGNLHKKLVELETQGILRSRRRGNQKHYGLNSEFPLREEYRRIILKTVGLEESLRNALAAVDGIERAFVYGSYAANAMDASSDIDLIVVGRHDPLAVTRKVVAVQKTVDREINVINMTPKEFSDRKRKDPFLKAVEKGRKVELV
jgi:predicted nucleotidyltransferase